MGWFEKARHRLGLFTAEEALELYQKENPVLPSLLTEATTTGSRGGVEPLNQDFEAYLHSVGVFHDVAACVDAIAQNGASVDLKVMKETDGESEELPNHPLLALLNDPNPEQGSYSFRYALLQSLGYTGEAYIVSDTAFTTKHVQGSNDIWVARASRMKPVLDKTAVRQGKEANPISHWVYDGWHGEPQTLDVEQVIQIRRPNPFDAWRGLSPLKELEQILNTHFSVNEAVTSYFLNGMKPSGLITSENMPTKEVADRARSEFSLLNQGVRKKRSVVAWLFGKGIEYNQLSDSLSDAAPLELLEYLKREVQSVYKVPNFALADPDGSTWANSREQNAMFFRNAIQPVNRLIFDTLNASPLVKAYGDGVFLTLDYSQVDALQPDHEAQSRRDVAYVKAGIQTINEIRALREMGEPVEWGDERPAQNSNPFGGMDFGDLDEEEREEEMEQLSATELRQVAKRIRNKDEARGILWRAVEKRREPLERGFAKAAKESYGALDAAISDEIDRLQAGLLKSKDESDPIPSSWLDLDLFDYAQMFSLWVNSLRPLADRAYQQGAEDTLQALDDVFVPFDMEREAVKEFISRHVASHVETILKTQQGEVRAIVKRAVEDGKTIGELAGALRANFRDKTEGWATRIARTETAGIYSAGTQAGMEQAGMETKEWLSARDTDVRPTHSEADGQIVALNANFAVGSATGPFPGAMSTVEENVNCRCAVVSGDV